MTIRGWLTAFFLWVAAMTPCAFAAAQPAPVILISIDTLRADRLGCYGGRVPTPNIDALAKSGTLFSKVSAQIPLTLPSHASLLTSTYPFSNGVRDNGDKLSPKIVSLAAVLKGRGYRTAAFVGGFVLDRRFGLNQGFDVYDSPFDLHRKPGVDPGDVSRAGADVAAAAMHWIGQNSTAPFFVFLHLYDLHTPRSNGASYEGALQYVDGVLGTFLNFLEKRNLLKKSLVVFTSDHGEGLGDHGESTHGYFIYESTLHVPLIIRWPEGAAPTRNRVDEPASLLDVAPTILDALGVQRPQGMQGRSVRTASQPTDVYAESYYAERHFGCAILRSVRSGRYKYLDAPKPELYDISADLQEQHNLYDSKRAEATRMRQRLMRLRARFPAAGSGGSAALTPDAIAALRSLGYLAGGARPARSSANKIDPKDRIEAFEQYGRAIALGSSGKLTQANVQLTALAEQLPDVPDIRLALGLNQQKLGEHAQAAENFRQVLRRDPAIALAHFNLAVSLLQLRQLDEAEKEARAALAIAPWYSQAEALAGSVAIEKKDYAGARATYEHLITVDPDNYLAHYNLGALYATDRKWDDAERHLRAALKSDPNAAEAYNALGSVYLQRDELDRGRDAFEHAIRLQPKFAWAHYNLGLVFRKEQKKDEAAQAFRNALAADPRFTPARTALERLER